MQTRLQSFIEANVNTALGFVGSLILTLIVNLLWMPHLGPAVASVVTTILCTVWSIVRGYFVRRWFARRHHVHSSTAR